MHERKSKARKRARLTVVYTLMVLAVITIVTILVMITQGYRFNRYDGRVEQGGLVQFNSRPSGAAVYLDGIRLSNQTPSRITVTAGTHTIEMKKDGYIDWRKQVSVKPGAVLWLNYARLYPTNPKHTQVTTYNGMSSGLPSPKRNYMAAIVKSATPTIDVWTLNDATPKLTSVNIPASAYTATKAGTKESFSLLEWDSDERHVLVKHTYNNTAYEYLSVDVRGDDKPVNITKQLGIDATDVHYSRSSSSQVYMLTTKREVRRGDLSSLTISGPLITNVRHFSLTYDSTLVYETRLSNGVRSVGYWTNGASKARIIKSYQDDGKAPLSIAMGEYFGDTYVAIVYAKAMTILRGDVPASDSNSGFNFVTINNVALSTDTTELSFSPKQNRFVYAVGGSTVIAYDLELDVATPTKLQGTQKQPLNWLDDYHFATTLGGNGYYYEFDGTNSQLVDDDVRDIPMVISNNNNYLYYVANGEKNVSLMRVSLTN